MLSLTQRAAFFVQVLFRNSIKYLELVPARRAAVPAQLSRNWKTSDSLMNIEDQILQNEELVKKIKESESQLGEPMTIDEFLEWLNKPGAETKVD